uniref:Uncharacterized protein n=1 Tax=Cyprinus carpio TaxID=7962 RepID=A0A8C2FB22_CYPCA
MTKCNVNVNYTILYYICKLVGSVYLSAIFASVSSYDVVLSVCRMRALRLFSLINQPPHRTIGSRRQSEDEAFPVAVWSAVPSWLNMTTNGRFNSRESRNGCYPVPQTVYVFFFQFDWHSKRNNLLLMLF